MPARPDLENNDEFWDDLLNEDMTRDGICEKWNASAGYVSSRRKRARAGERVKSAISFDEAVAQYRDDKFDPEKGASYTRMADTAWGEDHWREFLRETGTDPDTVTFSYGVTSNPAGGYWNKLINVRPKKATEDDGAPKWPVIQPASETVLVKIAPLRPTPRASKFKTAVVAADTQIGFDMDDHGNLTPYHDEAAIDIFLQVVALENPDQTIIAGDILDLAEQGRWAQEARFAQTTQPALEYARTFAAKTRANTDGEIEWIEGNHDKRMQSFMEANAKASMGLRKAGYPDSWPVMSLPNLIGLDEFDTGYVDAYPAAQHWICDNLRVIHGTRANSKGSTASQYANDMPHISTIFGHTHRLEVQSKTTFDRAGKIRTMNVNPGCLCRVDGTVPSVHGARHLDGSKATYWEDWQQGVAVIRYLDSGKFYVELVQIDEGLAFHQGGELAANV